MGATPWRLMQKTGSNHNAVTVLRARLSLAIASRDAGTPTKRSGPARKPDRPDGLLAG
jgi:hypothetical protein